jgi:hypothetical protein
MMLIFHTGVEYRMGYVDPGPAPRVNGALRLVTPLLTYPNHSVCTIWAEDLAIPTNGFRVPAKTPE